MDAINMEVKIKIGDEMIDAKIVMMNGDMIVSPKVVKFEPKDGDVVSTKEGNYIFIFKNGYKKEDLSGYCHIGWNLKNNTMFRKGIWVFERHATEEEKNTLFDKLAEEGWEWKADTKELVKIKWKPKVDEIFYYPFFEGLKAVVRCISYMSEEDIDGDEEIQSGKVFKTEQECQEFCNRLNDAISQVKP